MPPSDFDGAEDGSDQSGTLEHTLRDPRLLPVILPEAGPANPRHHVETLEDHEGDEDVLINLDPPEVEISKRNDQPAPYLDLAASKSSPKYDIRSRDAAQTVEMHSRKRAKSPSLRNAIFTEYGKIAKLQDRFLTDQSRLKYARDTACARTESLKESLHQFMDESESIGGQGSDRSLSKAREAAHIQLHTDIEVFEDEMQHVTDIEQSLGRSQYKLAKMLPKLLKRIEDSFKSEGSREARPTSPSTSSRSRQSLSPPLTPLEREYYDRRGEVRLLQDQVFELLSRIQKLYDNDFAVPTPPTPATKDPAFVNLDRRSSEELWAQYETTQQQLQRKERELKRAWKACKEAGLNVGFLGAEVSWRTPVAGQAQQRPLNDIESFKFDIPPFIPDGLVPQFLKEFRWPQRGDFTAPTMPDLAGFGEKREMIERWLQIPSSIEAIFRNPPEPPAGIALGNTVSPPKSDSEWILLHKPSDGVLSPDDSEIVAIDDRVVTGPAPLHSEGVRRLRREWRSEEALRQRFGRDPRPKRGSADVHAGVGTHQS